jgi:fimbrial chaperone protein
MPLRALLRHAGLLLALTLGAGAATAGSFSVSPVRVTLSAAEPIAALVVRNSSDEPAVVQLEATSWIQQDGADRYEPTRELLATPPIFTVPAHGTQVVRVGLRRAPDPRRELTFRLYLTEVPAPPPADFVGMRVTLRFGVPVFVAPAAAKGTEALQWQAQRAADGGLQLVCVNNGSIHARLVSFSLAPGAGGAALMTQPVGADVHAGQRYEWLWRGAPLPPSGTALRVSAMTERGAVHADLVIP